MEKNEENTLWKKYCSYNSGWQKLFDMGSGCFGTEDSTEQDEQKSDFDLYG